MADITAFPNVIAGIADADKVAENLYAPKATPDTFDVLNGWLDQFNLASGEKLDATRIRRGAYSRPHAVGATANTDLFSDSFGGSLDNALVGDIDAYYGIPGAGATVHVPWAGARALIRWNIAIATDGSAHNIKYVQHPTGGNHGGPDQPPTHPQDRGTIVCTHVNTNKIETPLWSTFRWYWPAREDFARFPTDPGKSDAPIRHGYKHDRQYCGHTIVSNLGKGYHSFGLKAWMSLPGPNGIFDGMIQTRFRVRGFRVIILRG